MRSLRQYIRELVAAGATVFALGSGWYMVGPPTTEGDVLRVAAFNIQVFGKTKAGKPDVMDVLARTVREFDIVVVQEVRDATESVADTFLDRINSDDGPRYAMVEGPRVGRTSSKEQYVIYYRPSTVEFLSSLTVADPDDVFEREPLAATFRAGEFDFTLVAIHIKPDDAEAELAALADVAGSLLADNSSEQDIILLGDFNADCRYFDEDDGAHPLRAPEFNWLIENDWDTTTSATDCTYDRIIVPEATAGGEYIDGSAAVFYFDSEYGLEDEDFVRRVSDHYPVFAEFETVLPDDD